MASSRKHQLFPKKWQWSICNIYGHEKRLWHGQTQFTIQKTHRKKSTTYFHAPSHSDVYLTNSKSQMGKWYIWFFFNHKRWKQGDVLSAILFCVYIDDLISQLRRNRTGCWFNGDYVGVIVYADDIVLLSPTLDGLQEMIHTCSTYAKNHNLSFSTHDNPRKSKTKCMAFLKKKRDLKKLALDDKQLPWVNSVKHLGTTLTDILDMGQDLLQKRAQYIAKNNELTQEFYYAHPSTKVLANNIFNTHFYGAPLWDLFSPAFQKLEKTWNTSHRLMLSLPLRTHMYLIEPLIGRPHIITLLWKRSLKFINCVRVSQKAVLRNMLHLVKQDCRSITGRNRRKIELMVNQDDNANKRLPPYCMIPDNEKWRIALVREIMDAKSGIIEVANFTTEELDTINEFTCCS